jgi:UDP-3-O-[3-hydroxymyristoyl] N-acetylglucosamine deacetylase
MTFIRQRTLKSLIKARGIAVHSGKKSEITLRPAAPNTGVVFHRVDCDPVISVPALSKHVGCTRMSTCLIKSGVRISTVEHLLSAVAGLGIDNLHVDINSSELPIMDGSSAPFVFLLQSAGIEEQDVEKQFVRVKKSVTVESDDGRYASLHPYNGYKIDFAIDFDHPVIRRSKQTSTLDFSSTSYIKEVSRARTFGFLSEVELLQKHNLALGGSLDNAIVLDDFRVLNDSGLRYGDEFVRHKMLDVVGDMYLLGHALIGRFDGYKSGHDLNNLLLHKLLSDESAFEKVTYQDTERMPISLFPALSATA